MRVTGNVGAILSYKGTAHWTVAPEDSVYHAIALMADKNIGALLVMEGEKLVGVVSERDYSRKVMLRGRGSKETSVRDIMGTPPITVTSQQSVDECLHIMTAQRVRHLPVVDGEKVAGVISIGDLVNWVISAQSATIEHLQSYISGSYPGQS